MAYSTSMFLFEFNIDKLKHFIKKGKQEFDIKARFADVFNISLENPTKEMRIKSASLMKKKLRCRSRSQDQSRRQPRLETGSVILFESDVNQLKQKMENFPLVLSLYDSDNKAYKLGTTAVPWGAPYFEYLNELATKTETEPLVITTKHKIYSEITSKAIVLIRITVKLSQLDNNPLPFSEIHDFQDSRKLKICDELATEGSVSQEKLNNNKSLISIGQNIFAEEEIEALTHEEINKPINIIMLCLRNSIENLVNNTNVTPPLPAVRSKSMNSIYESVEYTAVKFQCRNTTDTTLTTTDYFVGYVSVQPTESVSSKKSSAKVSFHGRGSETTSEQYCDGNPCDPSCEMAHSDKGREKMGQSAKAREKMDQSAKAREKMDQSAKGRETMGHSAEGKESVSLTQFDLPEAAKELISVTKCDAVDCEDRIYRREPKDDEQQILLDLQNVDPKNHYIKCTCETAEEQADVYPCFCTCECKFEFDKTTVYCKICGGYETIGEDTLVSNTPGQPLPFPCPIFHNLGEKKSITSAVVGKASKSSKSSKGSKGSKDQKEPGVEKGKVKKKDKDSRFKFKVGFEGIPVVIGHDKCRIPPGTAVLPEPVPGGMGWMWNADNIAGLKFRPNWKPGACHKKIVRMLKLAKNPTLGESKKKKKHVVPKPIVLKPLLTVNKKGEEFIITLESMKKYARQRLPNQYPYEDKPPVTFTVGKSEEEKLVRKKQKERRAKWLEYEQRVFIQSAFRNLCHKICLKTYEQALGLLPGAETTEEEVESIREDMPPPSCVCSEEELSSEDTDLDQWCVEFSPPNVIYKPKLKPKKIIISNAGTQYNYLDYRVELYDNKGKEVPRFFVGPDGKQECSDLGGFWGPNHKWLNINTDGFIAVDGRWAPFIFTVGPNDEQVEAEGDTVQLSDGRELVIGVDGYIDENNKWRYYRPPKAIKRIQSKTRDVGIPNQDGRGDSRANNVRSECGFSCFGDAAPHYLSQLGITGHGHDKKMLTQILREMVAKGEKVRIPNWEIPYTKRKDGANAERQKNKYIDEFKCTHSVPSSKGVIAVDDWGRKTYFRITNKKNKKYTTKDRLAALEALGIKMSEYHIPCLHSFINSEEIKQQNYQHILDHNARVINKNTLNVV